MHELPVTRSILQIVLRHAELHSAEQILAIDLTVGPLSDLEPEWLQRYFDHLSRGTVAENAELRIRSSPLVFECGVCRDRFEVPREDLDKARCPGCESHGISIVSGTGYVVESMEVE